MGTVSLCRLSETKNRIMRLHILLVLVLVVLATSLPTTPTPTPTTPTPTPTTPTDTSKSKLHELFIKVMGTVENILSKIVSIFRKKNDEGKVDTSRIINKMKGLNSDLQEKLLMIASKFDNLPPLNKVFELLMNEEEMMKDLLEKDGDMESNLHHFKEFFKYIKNILDDIADNSLISMVVNNLISKATEKLPLETVEETLLLVPWILIEDTLENLQKNNLTIQNIQELVHAFSPLIEHVIDLISTFENESIAFFGEIISRENELDLDDMIDAGRKAELLLHHAADAITNNNLRYFTNRITEHITKAINLIPKGHCAKGRATTPMKVVCYYPNWVYYRKGDGKYTVDDIDTSNSRGWNLGNFRKFTALKQSNPNVKYMLALGGWNDSKMPKYSELLASSSKIERFVEHAVGFLKEYGFDGLDLDYEYPSYDGHGRDAPDSDKPGFTLL